MTGPQVSTSQMTLLTLRGLHRLAGKRLNRDMDKKEFMDWIAMIQKELDEKKPGETKTVQTSSPEMKKIEKVPLSRELAIKVLDSEIADATHPPAVTRRLRAERLRAGVDPDWMGIDYSVFDEQKGDPAPVYPFKAPQPTSVPPQQAQPLALPPGTIVGAVEGRPSLIPPGYLSTHEIADSEKWNVRSFTERVVKRYTTYTRTETHEPVASNKRENDDRHWKTIKQLGPDGAKYYTSSGDDYPRYDPNGGLGNPISICALSQHNLGESNAIPYWRPDAVDWMRAQARWLREEDRKKMKA